jgi:CubicO group peptidase (beta-lactamase class C family)
MRPAAMDRRKLLKSALWGAGVVWAGGLPPLASSMAYAQTMREAEETPDPTSAERAAMAQRAQAFMQQYDIPALSVAVGRAGALIYQEGFGWADREEKQAASPASLFRIASVSKPITSVTVFSLVEDGRLQLSDRVFGPGAILGTDYGEPPYHPHVDEITIEHLLTHTAGGWSNDHDDPMFMYPRKTHAELIEWTLSVRPLDNPPGQNFAYSNFGYCVLGRVIEKVAGRTYEAFVRDTTLARCDVADMVISGNTLAERRPDEVKYYGLGDFPYRMNVARMDSHGGWLARPTDLVQFLMHVSGFAEPINILKPETIRVMTTGSAANAGYAKGWAINKAGNWWHSGSLPGSSTIAVRTHSGFCWAAFVNTRRPGSSLDDDLDRLVWNMVREVKSWRV